MGVVDLDVVDRVAVVTLNRPEARNAVDGEVACDLVVASASVTFGIPEVKRALVAGAGGLFRLPRALPRNLATELALTGDPIGAERAAALGPANELVEPGRARDAAVALANRIAANAPGAVPPSLRLVLASQDRHDGELWELTRRAQAAAVASEDFEEGPRAFIEKRAPRWTGR